MLDPARVQAITLDLDDTLWPVAPVIERAERVLQDWLAPHAPRTAALLADAKARQTLRDAVLQAQPELAHNLGAVRQALIRLALAQSGEDPQRADGAFEVFLAARHQVQLYGDALPALQWLAARYPVVALTNGNADVDRVGLGSWFAASVSAAHHGQAKPHPSIFGAAAQAVGVLPECVLHIGDDAELDVLGARGAGMQTVWVNRSGLPWTHTQRPHHTVQHLTELCDLLA